MCKVQLQNNTIKLPQDKESHYIALNYLDLFPNRVLELPLDRLNYLQVFMIFLILWIALNRFKSLWNYMENVFFLHGSR